MLIGPHTIRLCVSSCEPRKSSKTAAEVGTGIFCSADSANEPVPGFGGVLSVTHKRDFLDLRRLLSRNIALRTSKGNLMSTDSDEHVVEEWLRLRISTGRETRR